ncbi:MAG: hypothetical protein ACQ9ET_02880 [Nitrosomonadaceae bacterium]
MKVLNLGVIGAGFVGGSVIHGFKDGATVSVVDPIHSPLTIEQLVFDSDPSIIFICVPTPESASGEVDVSITNAVLGELDDLGFLGVVVIKSTITADHLQRIEKDFFRLRIVYNPEFLTEANAHHDFCNPAMQILGGKWADCEEVERAYVQHSSVKVVPTFKTDMTTASMLKYAINSYLATKVIFMNELRTMFEAAGTDTSWEHFTEMLSCDKRIGDSHLQVPGPDGKFGFGGHCFPKDTAALHHYAMSLGIDLSVLRRAMMTNKEVRDE